MGFDGVRLSLLGIVLLFSQLPALARPPQSTSGGAGNRLVDATARAEDTRGHLPDQGNAGNISGRVVDRTGGVIAQAHVKLSREDQSSGQDALSDSGGNFTFVNIAQGPFQLTVSSDGFATQIYTGTLQAGETCIVPAITLAVASASTEVLVSLSRTELAQEEIRDEEKQRIFGIVPNFYVTYDSAAVPLRLKQKFELAWKSIVDPINLGMTGAIAGFQQATNGFAGYGQGADGYAKRFAANYADFVTGTFIGGVILPTFLKQDPRYFYKGSGSIRSRVLYAIANTVIRKGDQGQWQPNYSGLVGGLAAGEISNLYYPAANRSGGEMFKNTIIAIGETAATNLLQEFVIRKLTPHAPSYAPAKP